MKVSVSKAQLVQALSIAQNIAEKRTSMPILLNVLLSCSADNQLTVAATDLDISALLTLEAEVEQPGRITLSAKMLFDVVRELPDGQVRLELGEKGRCQITAGRASIKLIGISADEFPSLPGLAIEPSQSVNAKNLLDMVNKTIYAVSHDETRFNLNGVCFEQLPAGAGSVPQLRLVATDGHRLAMVTREVPGVVLEGSSIVPTKGLQELRKLLEAAGEGDIQLTFAEGFLVAAGASAKLAMRLIDGEFPNYSLVVPEKKGFPVGMPAHELASALRRVALVVSDKEKCVRFSFNPSALTISSASPEVGEASETIEVSYTGEPLLIGFNSRYLIDIVASLEPIESLAAELHGSSGPGVFFDERDRSYLSVVMPMRLQS